MPASGTSRQSGPLHRRPTYGSKADPRNQPPPAHVLHPFPPVQPPRDDARSENSTFIFGQVLK